MGLNIPKDFKEKSKESMKKMKLEIKSDQDKNPYTNMSEEEIAEEEEKWEKEQKEIEEKTKQLEEKVTNEEKKEINDNLEQNEKLIDKGISPKIMKNCPAKNIFYGKEKEITKSALIWYLNNAPAERLKDIIIEKFNEELQSIILKKIKTKETLGSIETETKLPKKEVKTSQKAKDLSKEDKQLLTNEQIKSGYCMLKYLFDDFVDYLQDQNTLEKLEFNKNLNNKAYLELIIHDFQKFIKKHITNFDLLDKIDKEVLL